MSTTDTVTGTFEIHIFVDPLDPDAATAGRFQRACTNASTPERRIKGLLLNLDYVNQGFVGVLQTSRYVQGSLDDAKAAAREDAAMLTEAGFVVIREKVEAVTTSHGIPRNFDEGQRAPKDRYFEFHILIEPLEGPIADADVVTLRGIATELSQRWSSPVPLSYNAFKPAQRFLNARMQGVGLDAAEADVREIESAIRETGTLRVVKVISEYICSDTNRALDSGWLDPLLPTSPATNNTLPSPRLPSDRLT